MDNEQDGRRPHLSLTEDNVRAFVEMFGLPVHDGQVEELTAAVAGAFEGLPSLWRYRLGDVDTAVRIPTEGRR